jgi:dihydrofolate reductase
LNFTAIVAMDRQRGIGRDGDMPWHLPADLKYFARITKGAAANPGAANSGADTASAQPTEDSAPANTVIMGRKTWDSIPARYRPLSGRSNIVISRQENFQAEGCRHASSLEQALEMADRRSSCFVIGGAMIYALALQHESCTELLITEINAEFDCAVFFPALDDFTRVEMGEEQSDNGLNFRFCRWQRR